MVEDNPIRTDIGMFELNRRQRVMQSVRFGEPPKPREHHAVQDIPVEEPLEEAVDNLHAREDEQECPGTGADLRRPQVRQEPAEHEKQSGKLQTDLHQELRNRKSLRRCHNFHSIA